MTILNGHASKLPSIVARIIGLFPSKALIPQLSSRIRNAQYIANDEGRKATTVRCNDKIAQSLLPVEAMNIPGLRSSARKK